MIRIAIIAPRLIGAGRDAAVVPDHQHAADRGEQARDRVRGDPVRGDVVAERGHAARVVADALQRDAERRAHQVLDEEVAGERAGEGDEVERHRLLEVDAEELGRGDLAEALEAVEDGVVLLRQVEEGDADRERDHDRVDALGAHREPADRGGEQRWRRRARRRRASHHGQPRLIAATLLVPKIAMP